MTEEISHRDMAHRAINDWLDLTTGGDPVVEEERTGYLFDAIILVVKDATAQKQAGKPYPVFGVIECPACKGRLGYSVFGPRSATARCEVCGLTFMS